MMPDFKIDGLSARFKLGPFSFRLSQEGVADAASKVGEAYLKGQYELVECPRCSMCWPVFDNTPRCKFCPYCGAPIDNP